MENIFFTADSHFAHQNILMHNKRPWNNIEEMNEGLIEKWNAKVSKKDLTYIIGDFAFERHGYYLQRLNGKKILILGSHDKMPQKHLQCFSEVAPAKQIKIGNQFFYLNHCCQRIWEKSHYGSVHLFGHSHGRLQTFNLSFDVGVDALGNNYEPLSFEQIMKKITSRKIEMENCGRTFMQGATKMWQQDDVRYFQHNRITESEELASIDEEDENE